MRRYITALIVVLVFTVTSCSKYKYPQDKAISDKSGILIDTLKGFLPVELTFDGTEHNIQWDKERLEELNNYFLTTKEVALYNYYLDREIYRIVLQKKGESPIILAVNKQDKNAWLVSKRLNTDSIQNIPLELDSIAAAQAPKLKSDFDNYSRAWNSAHIQRFDSLFTAANFFELPIGETNQAFDSYYLMEVHQSDKYWYIYRPIEDSTLNALIEFAKAFSRF